MTSSATTLDSRDGGTAVEDSPSLAPVSIPVPVSLPGPRQPAFPPDYYLG